MSSMTDEVAVLLKRSHSVADSADFLSAALASGNRTRIDTAIDDVAAAYASYKGQARTTSARLGFDETAKQTSPAEREQHVTTALASALVDLQMAVVLGRAAQATGEVEGDAKAADVREAVDMLNNTLRALEVPIGPTGKAIRYGFDEVKAVPPSAVVSPDVLTAKANYGKQTQTVYEALVGETVALLKEAFGEVSKLDSEQISAGLKIVAQPLKTASNVGKLAQGALETTLHALEVLRGTLGPEIIQQIEEQVKQILNEIREGGDLLQRFLKNCYEYDEGQKEIAEELRTSQADTAKIDQGAKALTDLHQQIVQTYALLRRIITTLRTLSTPLNAILKHFGGTLPLDLLMGSVCLLAMDVAILRGMDYADSAQVVKFVEGIRIISKRTLGSIGQG